MYLPKTPIRFIFYFLKNQYGKVLLMMLASLAWASKESLFPYFLKNFVNTLQSYPGDPEKAFNAVGTLFSIFSLVWIVSEIFQRSQGLVSIYFFPKLKTQIRTAVFDYVQLHSNEYFANNFAGNISNKISNLPTSCHIILEMLIEPFLTAILYVSFVIVMFFHINALFAWIFLTWLCLHALITFSILMKGNKLWEIHSEAVSTLNGKIVDVLTNISNVRLFSKNKYESQYLTAYLKDEVNKSQKAMWNIELANIAYAINGSFLIIGTTYMLIYAWGHRWISLGDFTQIGMQTIWSLGWVWHISFMLTQFTRELGTVKNSLKLINVKHELVDKPNAPSLIVKKGEIQFKDVCFYYRKKSIVFNHLNVTIHPGEKIGLVGFSGSGKSTFVNLILRFYDLQSGQIQIDNQTIAEVTQDSLRSQISMIPQDPSLFHRSLMENIRYGRLNASDEEVIQASKLAHCHEFIEFLDQGYHCLVGERGIKLSGGQRQRIAIARAILKNAPILILDEATSSLDSVTEKIIHEGLENLMKNKTTLVIAHRLSTLANMDRILVFHHGKIIEQGTKESLLELKGHFYTLWNMQSNGFLPE